MASYNCTRVPDHELISAPVSGPDMSGGGVYGAHQYDDKGIHGYGNLFKGGEVSK